jgi:hypothetical protein
MDDKPNIAFGATEATAPASRTQHAGIIEAMASGSKRFSA